MRVAGLGEPGGPDVLRPMEIAAPEASPGGVDAALDGAGGDALEVSLKLVRDRNRAAFPLDRAADAHREVATGHGRGKVVLTLPEEGRDDVA